MELAQESGGIIESICGADFQLVLSEMRARMVNALLSEYVLDRRPRIGTITVIIDGQVLPNDPENGWTYDADRNSIRFHGSGIPGAHSNTIVDYDPESAI